MSTPTPTKEQEELGRTGRVFWAAGWDATNVSDFVADKILDINDATTAYENPRYAVEYLEWSGSAAVSANIYFDSLADDGTVYIIPDGATSGEIDFSKYPSGSVGDKNKTSPGNLVIDTFDAADGENLSLVITYRVKGTRGPN